MLKTIRVFLLTAAFTFSCVNAFSYQVVSNECPKPEKALGIYFSKKAYVPVPLPKYEDLKSQLPSPIVDDNPLWVETHWKAWQLAFKNFYEPPAGSGFVSQFIDAAFSDNVFLWDSSFMTMFCNFGSPLVPAISTRQLLCKTA